MYTHAYSILRGFRHRRSPYRHLCLALLFVLALGGCAHNTVPLTYTAYREVIPTADAANVCVVMFADARPQTAIGERSDGSAFVADSDVRAWVSRALAAELSHQGFAVTLAASEEEAQAAKAGVLVTGTIDAIWLKEESSTAWACSMRASLLLKKNGKPVLKNSFSSSLSRRVIVPLASVPQEIVAENLGDLVRPMALAVEQNLQSN